MNLRDLPANMLSKIDFTDSCWNWTGAVQSRGYGSVTNGKGGTMQAHRRAYMELVGPIPTGLTIDHLCRNKRCVNPDHLEPVTGAENTRRAFALQTHCKHGHPLSGENLRLETRDSGNTYRICITCSRAHKRRAMAAHRKAMREEFASRSRPDLRAALRDAHITVTDAASRIGLSQQSLSRRLSGESLFVGDELARIEFLLSPTARPVDDLPPVSAGRASSFSLPVVDPNSSRSGT